MATAAAMDEAAAALEALSDVLNRLAENPYDISLHAENVRIAYATGMEDQVESALEMVTAFWAAGDKVWLPLIERKQSSGDMESAQDLKVLLELFERAEQDYLSIPLLTKHLEFLVERYEHLTNSGSRAEDLGELFTTEWTHEAISSVVSQGVGHLTQSHILWDVQRDWELEVLANAPDTEKAPLVSRVEALLLERLQQPHSNHADTLQAYSTFTTIYKPPDQYEALLVKASKMRSQAVKAYEKREEFESSLAQAGFSLEAYAYYLSIERRKKLDLLVLKTLYERAIAEGDKRRFDGEAGAEDALRSFWSGYIDLLRTQSVDDEVQLATLKRALRSVPTSGEVWARYLRFLERVTDADDAQSEIAAAYKKTQSIMPLQAEVDQLVPVVLARVGYEKRRIAYQDEAGEYAYDSFLEIMLDGITRVRKTSTTGDPRLRLEKYFSAVCLDVADLSEHALIMWEDAAKHYKTSYFAWSAYTDVLIKQKLFADVRKVFRDISMKNLDWPEAIWEAWLNFEQLYGSVEDIEDCIDRIDRAQIQVNARRAKEAEKANLAAMQLIAEQQANAVPVSEAPRAVQPSAEPVPMDVDVSGPSEGASMKRKAEDEALPEETKKPKIEEKPTQLKRDRENCTVFVADLPAGVLEAELAALFKDCGSIREIKITRLPNSLVATVEFIERDSVPAALTKDKKRLRGEEIAVHLAWQSTLYITNFPEKADDAFIRNVFSKYGTVFDVRWPSKKFRSTRRFCYFQYTTPSSAQAALELHGQELEPGLPLTVLISNPERKKERTDSDANDKEIYVAGLSKFATKEDLEKLFKTYGAVKEVRMALTDDGHSKGFAFVEFEQEKDALAALSANNYELKKRRMAVTLADTRVKAKHRDPGHRADVRSRSLRIRNLPAGTQEGLLQQALEKYAPVNRVEVFENKHEADVELENAADAGKLLLFPEPIVFNGNPLELLAENAGGAAGSRPAAPLPATGGMFVPRTALSRPRAGLGSTKRRGAGAAGSSQAAPPTSSQPSDPSHSQGKGQDDFRKMLSSGK